MEQGHVLVAAGLGIRYPRQAVQLEAQSVPPLAPVHVVPEGEDDLQHLAEPLAALHLLAALQHRLQSRGLRLAVAIKNIFGPTDSTVDAFVKFQIRKI